MSDQGINEAGGRSGGKRIPVDLSNGWDEPIPLGDIALPAFPTAALPAVLQAYVEPVADTFQVPIDVPAMISLAIGAASVAKKAKVKANADFVEPLNLYIVIAMTSGSGKSPPFRELMVPVEAHERQLNEEGASHLFEEAQRYRILQAKTKHLENEVARGRAKARDELARVNAELRDAREPVSPRLIVDNVTPEKLTTLLYQHGGRLALFSPEGELFNLVAGRYSPSSTPNIDVLLRAHSGETIRVDRGGRASEFVHNPALTICTMVQPDVVRGLAKQPVFRHRGLLARFLFCMRESLVGARKARRPVIPEPERFAFRTLITRLLELDPFNTQAGEMTPHLIRLSPHAAERFYDFMERHEPRLLPLGEFGPLTDWGGKLAGTVLRLAGILHLARNVLDSRLWTLLVADRTMQDAITIGEYLGTHARAAYDLMAADERLEDARYLLGWIERNGKAEFSRREAHRGTKSRFQRVEALSTILDMLAERGYIREARSDVGGSRSKREPTAAEVTGGASVNAKRRKSGRPTGPQYEVNPALWQRETHSVDFVAFGST